jgi:hypothetical protein
VHTTSTPTTKTKPVVINPTRRLRLRLRGDPTNQTETERRPTRFEITGAGWASFFVSILMNTLLIQVE